MSFEPVDLERAARALDDALGCLRRGDIDAAYAKVWAVGTALAQDVALIEREYYAEGQSENFTCQ